jgi:hypothetical protein
MWVGDIMVGLIPLLADSVLENYAQVPKRLARCQQDAAGMPIACTWIRDSSEAEFCIFAVVVAGLTLLPMIQPSGGRTPTVGDWARYVAGLGLLVITVAAGILYGLIASGINGDTTVPVRAALVGAIAVSFILTLDRAARDS